MKLAVLVPYRDRPEHLEEFAPVLSDYLAAEDITFSITVVNQADGLLFNRAKLLNVGFLETHEQSDYTAFHDVDMLPKKPNAGYHYTETARQVHCPTEYSMGGISLANNKVNWDVNGWANSYWGWGGEDRNYCHRFKNKSIPLEESQGYRRWAWAKEHFRELKSLHDPRRKNFKKRQQQVTKQFISSPHLNDEDGLNNCVYNILDKQVHELYTILNVDLSE